MKWLQRMNEAVNFIEDNLTNDIDLSKVAEKACCSVYHFQRMFSFIIDIPLSEYIRRRRLTLAAFELQSSTIKVIDLALKYGYESSDAFSRAFRNLHGVTPTLARNAGVQLKAFPRLSFHISIKGDVEMNYRIVEKDAYDVFGKSITIGLNDNPFEVIPKLWLDFQEDGTYQNICEIAGFEPYSGKLLSAAAYDYNSDESYRNKYIIYTMMPNGKDIPKEFDVLTIPKAKWVVFSEKFRTVEESIEVIQNIWKRVFTEWFPNSEYEVANGPQLEVFPEDSDTVEVWIPVIKN
ncbi:AraC family transcriptional regulator [Mycoplasmatota bacterium WC44]